MEFHSSSMELHKDKWIMELHNYGVLSPLALTNIGHDVQKNATALIFLQLLALPEKFSYGNNFEDIVMFTKTCLLADSSEHWWNQNCKSRGCGLTTLWLCALHIASQYLKLLAFRDRQLFSEWQPSKCTHTHRALKRTRPPGPWPAWIKTLQGFPTDTCIALSCHRPWLLSHRTRFFRFNNPSPACWKRVSKNNRRLQQEGERMNVGLELQEGPATVTAKVGKNTFLDLPRVDISWDPFHKKNVSS